MLFFITLSLSPSFPLPIPLKNNKTQNPNYILLSQNNHILSLTTNNKDNNYNNSNNNYTTSSSTIMTETEKWRTESRAGHSWKQNAKRGKTGGGN